METMLMSRNLDMPQQLESENPAKNGDEFDVNSYLTVFNRLSMKPGYVLDFVYFKDDRGGKPLIYARKTDQKTYSTYQDYLKAIGEKDLGERSYNPLIHAYEYLDFVQLIRHGISF